MLEPQPAPLPHDILYVLDGALEHDELSAFAHPILCLFGDRTFVPEVVDREILGRGWRPRAEKMIVLDRYAHRLAAALPEESRRGFFAGMLLREPNVLLDTAECLASWNYDDETVGGAMLPYRHGTERVRRDGTASQRTAKHLLAPRAIRRYVRESFKEVDRLLSHRRDIAERMRAVPWPRHPEEARSTERYFIEAQARHREAIQRAYAALSDPLLKRAGHRSASSKDERKALRRSLSAASAAIGEEGARTLLRGEPVRLQGHLFDFVIRSRLRRSGHGGLTISLFGPDSEERLADLCLYFDGMPALDQAAALALHISSESEIDLIEAGNLFNLTVEGARNPLLMDRLRREGAMDVEQIQERVRRGFTAPAAAHRDRQAEQRAAYIRETRGTYLHAVTERVWGRDARRVREFEAAIGR